MNQPIKKHMPREEALAKVRAWGEEVVELHERATAPSGATLRDGSVMIGISPTTGQKIFALPQDAAVRMNFNEAAAYVDQLNSNKTLGHDDWRLPDAEELQLLSKLQKTGTFSETFNWAAKPASGNKENNIAPLYWSSKTYTQKWMEGKGKSVSFKDGIAEIRPLADRLCVRVIR